jgi:Fe-S-cluster-containing dehydrogenase component/CRP-like cAMP-binding protein
LRSYYIEQTPSDKVHQISGDMAAGVPVKKGVAEPIYRTPDDLIIGEMTCMSHYPRSATIRADEDTVVMEIMKNVLYVLQRNRASRKLLDDLYRERTFPVVMNELDLFAGVRKDAVRFKKLEDWLSSRLDLVRVNPGHRIFKQGDVADDLFIIRIGYVKFWQGKIGGEQIVRDYFGPNSYFGEIALLTGAGLLDLDPDKAKKHQLQAGLRTLNADAVDHVELVRISKDDFLQMCQDYPEIVEHAKATAQERLAQRDRIFWDSENTALAGYLRQGLANAQNLLVLDLESCTRCDECTKACSDSHQGITRLIRDGLRYDKYLVVSSCRSCQDPVCMIGCPTNAIHRGDSLEIRINDACIGCGQCASSCPYGNINMHPAPKLKTDEKTKRRIVSEEEHPKTGKTVPVIQYHATTCDACASVVPKGQDPNCVFACPHDAAHRLSGEDFLKRVKGLPALPPSAGVAAH